MSRFDEGDKYGDFDNDVTGIDANIEDDEEFNRALATSHGRSTFSNSVGIGGKPPTTAFRPTTTNRPPTAVIPANFNKPGLSKIRAKDPIEDVPEEVREEERLKDMERKVLKLVDDSIVTYSKGDYTNALDKAKSAGRQERSLSKLRENAGLAEAQNMDVTYQVLFNMAVQYEMNELYSEALSHYQIIVKNKMFQQVGKIRVNMGNIYFKMKEYNKAVKQYRMALDQVPNHFQTMRIRIMANIGACFTKLNQFEDAITSYEHIMNEHPDFKPGFNLILCYYAIRDAERMRKSFLKLLNVNSNVDDEKYNVISENKTEQSLCEIIQNDPLRQLESQRKNLAEKTIVNAAKLIAPCIEESFAAGFDWCVSQVKQSQYIELANDLEIHKALTHLKERDFEAAIKILKNFEKKDSNVKSQAANNLSFIYFLQQKYPEASAYASKALAADKYNPAALVNKGNCVALSNDWQAAVEYYSEALKVDAECTEALFNLGLACKKINKFDAALEAFHKLQNIQRKNPQVMFQIADIYRLVEDSSASVDWLKHALSVSQTDPGLLQELGNLHDNEGDKSSAFQYHYDAYKIFPGDIRVIEWLSSYYIESQFPEKASNYFARASIIEPHQVKWHLMNASCLRKIGNFHQALDKYRQTHEKFPESKEVLQYLVRLCSDMNMDKELKEYQTKLKKLEKMLKERSERPRQNSATIARRDRRDRARNQSNNRLGSGRINSGKSNREYSAKSGSRDSGSLNSRENSEYNIKNETVDLDFQDTLGGASTTERPKTSSGKRMQELEDFDDDDLLPE